VVDTVGGPRRREIGLPSIRLTNRGSDEPPCDGDFAFKNSDSLKKHPRSIENGEKIMKNNEKYPGSSIEKIEEIMKKHPLSSIANVEKRIKTLRKYHLSSIEQFRCFAPFKKISGLMVCFRREQPDSFRNFMQPLVLDPNVFMFRPIQKPSMVRQLCSEMCHR
jgi:hypothetical protein